MSSKWSKEGRNTKERPERGVTNRPQGGESYAPLFYLSNKKEENMMIHFWQKPAVDLETGRYKPCNACGTPAMLEFAKTIDAEPDKNTVWVPMCTECRIKHKE
jgi:hypothetical protein